jgi:hypothetical protein
LFVPTVQDAGAFISVGDVGLDPVLYPIIDINTSGGAENESLNVIVFVELAVPLPTTKFHPLCIVEKSILLAVTPLSARVLICQNGNALV